MPSHLTSQMLESPWMASGSAACVTTQHQYWKVCYLLGVFKDYNFKIFCLFYFIFVK